jgi:hypothetical protein
MTTTALSLSQPDQLFRGFFGDSATIKTDPSFVQKPLRRTSLTEGRTITAYEEAARDLERRLATLEAAVYKIQSLVIESEDDVPEVFDLRPLESRVVRVKIVDRRRAPFHWVAGEEPDFIDE